MDLSVDIVVVNDDVIVFVEDHLTLGVREGDMPAVSTNIVRGGGDGDRRRAAVRILGLLGVGTLIMLTLNLCLSEREPHLRH